MAKKKYTNMSKENISRLTKLSDAVGAAILAPLQSEPDLTLQEGLTCIAGGLMAVLDTLSEVIGEDPKDTLRTFIGALQDDLSRRP